VSGKPFTAPKPVGEPSMVPAKKKKKKKRR
jgi:hypothetical protein